MNISVIRELSQAAQQAQTPQPAQANAAGAPRENAFRMDDPQACPTDMTCTGVQQSQSSTDPARLRSGTSPEAEAGRAAGQVNDLMGRLNQMTSPQDAHWRKLLDDVQASNGDFSKIDPAINRFVAASESAGGPQSDVAQMVGLMKLQRLVQNAGMKLELSTKIVEHGTSGMKTVLQTQA